MSKTAALKVEQQKQPFHILEDGHITSAQGFKAGGLHCGLKHKRPDMGWVYSEVPADAAGVYTTNLFQAAPLVVTQESIRVENKIQAIVVNSGNANSCTGEIGLKNAYEMRRLTGKQFNVPDHRVAVVSTGVIGEQLPMDTVKDGIQQFQLENADVDLFERAILTTDTGTKHIAVQVYIDDQLVTIGGAAKGSGMIHPNMATMLGFVTTDAKINPHDLLTALKQVTNHSFNMITVDGDTSTNDMVLTLANGLAGNKELTKEHKQWDVFVSAFTYVCETLAKMIARDGEGATKLIEVEVNGAVSEEAARMISKSVVGSNLVKTAVFGADPNWGRMICAAGYSGSPMDPSKISVALGDIWVVKNGLPVLFDENKAKAYLGEDVVHISINLGDGGGHAKAWGCDLTYDYVKINASYRT
ncbi:MAG: bifunctional ornithine acetyltransferase/N-acetylglutamate synthase [Tuberibacillus sp.]